MLSIFCDVKGARVSTLGPVYRAVAVLSVVILVKIQLFLPLILRLEQVGAFLKYKIAPECDSQRVFKCSMHSIFGDIKGV